MKHLGLILAVVMASMAGQVLTRRIDEAEDSQSPLARASANDKFRAFLESARVILREGNSTLGIPVLDPYRNNKLEIELDEDFVKGTATVSNLVATGLSGYIIDTAEVAILSRKIVVGLTFPNIQSSGSYKLDILMKTIKAYGEGDYTLTLKDLSFKTTVILGISGGMSVKSMDTIISLDALEFSASGLFNDESTSKILSEVISDIAPQLLQDYQVELVEAVNEKAMALANEYLKGKTWKDMKEILGI